MQHDPEVSGRNPENITDLRCREPFDLAEDEGFSLSRGSAIETSADGGPDLGGLQFGKRITRRTYPASPFVESPFEDGVHVVQLVVALLRASRFGNLSKQDPEEPGAEFRASFKRGRPLDEGHESRLGHVLGATRVEACPPSCPHELTQIRVRHPRDRFRIATSDPIQKIRSVEVGSVLPCAQRLTHDLV